MGLMRVLPFAKHLLREHAKPGTVVIDMTAGNGHDTLFLAELIENGHVYAFDVQEAAVFATRQRLEEAGLTERVSVIHDSHHTVREVVTDETRPITAAVFNLGYLPGSDKTVTTSGQTTIDALEQLLDIMAVGGIIVVVIYHGHDSGKAERDDVLAYVEALDQKKAGVLRYGFINQVNHPPFIVAIEKRA
ncbi:class I SAM-dependent methyltransferase [Exiguobacterium aurantiacum]|uniref:16S rRNA m(4)C1402 methyltranserfase n=1 Tax=Exiguobacterium aurantiacum TaxID=33987 RepID=A0A377FSY5_9BACL|nr:class I SAM-dependent methyltransferase [Exiguobacterium aurantiacum]STO07674.1 16S rRNA m(4)C1402 methyltranserfase [Exiguobacterium aurantiacum]